MKADVVHHFPDLIPAIVVLGVVLVVVQLTRLIGVYVIRRELAIERRKKIKPYYNDRWGG
jgi:hypothetical protein